MLDRYTSHTNTLAIKGWTAKSWALKMQAQLFISREAEHDQDMKELLNSMWQAGPVNVWQYDLSSVSVNSTQAKLTFHFWHHTGQTVVYTERWACCTRPEQYGRKHSCASVPLCRKQRGDNHMLRPRKQTPTACFQKTLTHTCKPDTNKQTPHTDRQIDRRSNTSNTNILTQTDAT